MLSYPVRTSSALICVLSGAVFAQVGSTQEKAPAIDEPTRSVTFVVVDGETGTPISGAKMQVRIDRQRDTLTTDDAGRIVVEVPEKQPEYVNIIVLDAPGYAGMRASWQYNGQDQEALPGEHTFPLVRARSIGGRVVDNKGQPVEKARVHLLLTGQSDEKNRLYVNNNRSIARTDDEGNWSFDGAPPELTEFWMRVNHSDFPSDNVWDLKPSPDELYAHKAIIELTPGLSISGRVVDEDGNPIYRAKVYEGLQSRSGAATAQTDKEGKFTLKNLDQMRAVMTVNAEGYAPTMAVKTLKKDLKPVEIVLESGRVLKLKVVDTEGNPISGATVRPGAWRGGESLRMWPVRSPKTNAEGMLVWESAPTDAVEYSVLSKGLFPSKPVNITADGEVHTVVMREPFVVSGGAVDVETGKPISDYRVFPILYWKSGGSHISRYKDTPVEDARFEYTLTRLDCDHGVRVEAPGYRPITTESFDLVGARKTFAFELTKAPNIEAAIYDLKGKPVREAKITVCGAMDQVNINNGILDNMFRGFSVTPNDDGRFIIPPQDGPYKVVALTTGSYAEASGEELERTGRLTLQPWGKVSGRLVRGGKPVSGVALYISSIRLMTAGYPMVIDRAYTQTATDGTFAFNRVAPGSVILSTNVSPWEQSKLTSGERIPISVHPGKSYHFEMGNDGVSVTGNLALAKGDEREMAWNWAINYMYRKAPGIPGPEEVRDLGFSHADGWNEAWVSTPEGRAFFDTLEGHFVKLTPDGAFRIDGVKPGEYELAFRLYGEPQGTCLVSPISTATFDVSVSREGELDTILDLGTLIVDAYPELKAGDAAPEFDVAMLDGGTLKLSDLRGKFVLLDFWATWCAPCRSELPNFRAVWKKFGARDDFVILSLSLDSDRLAPQKMAKEENMPWLHGHLGDWSDTDLTNEYNVSGIPATFLIGPDGNLIARDLRGHAMIETIKKVLP